MFGMLCRDGQGYLMSAERSLDLQAIDDLGSRPAFGGVQDDHRPSRPRSLATRARTLLDPPDLLHGCVECGGHGLVHEVRLVPLDKEGRPTAAAQELLQLLAGDPGQHSGVRDLIAVQMQDRQYRAVGDGIQELVGMPRRRERAGLRFTIAHHTSDDQIRVVEHGAEGVAERVAELPAFVDRSWALRGCMTGNSARKRELRKEPLEPALIAADVGIDLAVGSFEVRVTHDCRAAVAGAGDIDHVEVIFLDDPVQMDVNEVLTGCRTPMPEQHRLHVRQSQRLFQQRIVGPDKSDRQTDSWPPASKRPSCAEVRQRAYFQSCLPPMVSCVVVTVTLDVRGTVVGAATHVHMAN